MKAIIDAADNAYIIRIYGNDGALCDIHVVEEIEVSDKYLNSMNEFSRNTPEIAA